MKLDWVAHSKRHCKHLHKSVWSDWTLHPCIRVLPSGGKRVKTGTKSLGGRGAMVKKKTQKTCAVSFANSCSDLRHVTAKNTSFDNFIHHPFLFFFHLSILFPRSHFKWKKKERQHFLILIRAPLDRRIFGAHRYYFLYCWFLDRG